MFREEKDCLQFYAWVFIKRYTFRQLRNVQFNILIRKFTSIAQFNLYAIASWLVIRWLLVRVSQNNKPVEKQQNKMKQITYVIGNGIKMKINFSLEPGQFILMSGHLYCFTISLWFPSFKPVTGANTIKKAFG